MEEMEIMNNEEIREEVTETTDMTVVDLTPVNVSEEQGSSTLTKVIIGAGVTIIGGFVIKKIGGKLKKVAVKAAAKFVDKQEGYSVCRPEDVETEEYDEDDFFEEDFEEPEVTPEAEEEEK